MAKDEKGSAVNPIGQRNPTPNRFGKLQLRFYALVSVFILTLALIAILEFVNRSLPDGAQSGYAPQLRIRDAPVLLARSSSSTAYFIPASSIVTVTSPTCPALPPSCACPYDAEIPNCSCSPDAAATLCTCTVKFAPSCGCDPGKDPTCVCTDYVRECVCPPDSKCNSCRCPGGGSYYQPCECPENPYAAGCTAYPVDAGCLSDAGGCGCSVYLQWTCGYGVTRSGCSVPTTTVGGIQPTFATIYPVLNTTTTTTTNVVTSSDVPSSSPLPISSQGSQAPFSRVGPLSNSSQPVDASAVTALPQPSVPAAVPTVPSPSLVASPPASISLLSSPPVAISTSSVPPVAATPPSITAVSPVVPIVAPGVATSPLQPGVILLISSTVVPLTAGPAPSQVAQVTFLRTNAPASGSVITGTSGSLYTIPAIILAANAVVTPNSPAPAATPAATLAAPTAPTATPVLSGSALTQPPTAGNSPNPTPLVSGASVLVSQLSVGGAVLPSNLQASGSLVGSLAAVASGSSGAAVSASPSARASATAASGSSGAAVSASPSARASATAASGSSNPSNVPQTAVSALNGAASASAEGGSGGGGGGGGGGASAPSPTPSAASGPVTVAIYSWPVSKTVLGGYIPIILARLFHGGWKAVYGHFDSLATVNQLMAHEGAPASALFGPGLALWYIWPAYVAVWCTSPFASELIYFDTNYGCANPNPDNPTNPCWPPIMSVNRWVSRVLQTLLALVAVTVLVLIALWFKKPSGSNGDPTSIAAVAAIMGHPEVERDFQAFDAEMSTKEMKKQLKDKKYRLSTYQTETNIQRYGMVPVPPAENAAQDAKRRGFASKAKSRLNVAFTFVSNLRSNWKTFQMRSDMVFMFYLFAVFATTILYLAHINNMNVIHLFDESTVGRRLLFAVIACIISTYWSKLQRDAQTLAPYADLAFPNEAPPQPTILFGKRSLAIVALYPLLRYRHFFAALTAFTAVLSEFFVVVLSGMPYRPGQLRSEFLFCGISSLVVLTIMLIMLLVVNLWRIFAVPRLPRKPDNIAAVMTYVCNSAMNKDFEGLEQDVKERNRHINELRKRYRYGLRRDADAKERWAVDEVGGAEDAES